MLNDGRKFLLRKLKYSDTFNNFGFTLASTASLTSRYLHIYETDAFDCVLAFTWCKDPVCNQDFVARPIWSLRSKGKLRNERMHRVTCTLVDSQEVCVVSAKL